MNFCCRTVLNHCSFRCFNLFMTHKLLENPYYLKQNPESLLQFCRISLNFTSHFGVFSKALEQPKCSLLYFDPWGQDYHRCFETLAGGRTTSKHCIKDLLRLLITLESYCQVCSDPAFAPFSSGNREGVSSAHWGLTWRLLSIFCSGLAAVSHQGLCWSLKPSEWTFLWFWGSWFILLSS